MQPKQINRLTNLKEGSYGSGGGRGWGGKDSEFRMDMFTLLYFKWITNKGLLYGITISYMIWRITLVFVLIFYSIKVLLEKQRSSRIVQSWRATTGHHVALEHLACVQADLRWAVMQTPLRFWRLSTKSVKYIVNDVCVDSTEKGYSG